MNDGRGTKPKKSWIWKIETTVHLHCSGFFLTKGNYLWGSSWIHTLRFPAIGELDIFSLCEVWVEHHFCAILCKSDSFCQRKHWESKSGQEAKTTTKSIWTTMRGREWFQKQVLHTCQRFLLTSDTPNFLVLFWFYLNIMAPMLVIKGPSQHLVAVNSISSLCYMKGSHLSDMNLWRKGLTNFLLSLHLNQISFLSVYLPCLWMGEKKKKRKKKKQRCKMHSPSHWCSPSMANTIATDVTIFGNIWIPAEQYSCTPSGPQIPELYKCCEKLSNK